MKNKRFRMILHLTHTSQNSNETNLCGFIKQGQISVGDKLEIRYESGYKNSQLLANVTCVRIEKQGQEMQKIDAYNSEAKLPGSITIGVSGLNNKSLPHDMNWPGYILIAKRK